MTATELAPYIERVRNVVPHGCGCSCCAQKAEKVKGGETVPKGDKFIKEELELAATLLALWEDAVDRTGIVDSIITAGDTRNTHNIDTALDNADVSLSQTVIDDDEEIADTNKPIKTAFLIGFGLAGATALSASRMAVSIGRILNGYNRQVQYFANQYFRRIAHPSLLKIVLAHGNDLHGNEDYGQVLKEAMDRYVLEGTEAYWRLVANHTISRAHHYGILRGAQEQGKLGYRLVAVLDTRTTELCLELNGREFWVADGINHLEKVAECDPEDISKVSPWVKAEDVKGKTSDELVEMGVMVPPFHGNCRTTLVTINT